MPLPSLDYVRGYQDAREQAAALLREDAANLRAADADLRGIPRAMGVSITSDTLDECAGRIAVMTPGAAPCVRAPAPAMGCICPPGANRDCENPLCPRRRP